MTTAKRTTLVRHLHLDIGYEQDISPAVLAGAILEALEPKLIDEIGIVVVQTESAYEPGAGTITIYAPLDQVKREEPTDTPPERPEVEGEITAAGIKRAALNTIRAHEQQGKERAEDPKVCPTCGENGRPDEEGYDEEVGFELCDDCSRKPNVGQ